MRGDWDSKDGLELILKVLFPRNCMKVKFVGWLVQACLFEELRSLPACWINVNKVVLTWISDFEDKSFLLSAVHARVAHCWMQSTYYWQILFCIGDLFDFSIANNQYFFPDCVIWMILLNNWRTMFLQKKYLSLIRNSCHCKIAFSFFRVV